MEPSPHPALFHVKRDETGSVQHDLNAQLTAARTVAPQAARLESSVAGARLPKRHLSHHASVSGPRSDAGLHRSAPAYSTSPGVHGSGSTWNIPYASVMTHHFHQRNGVDSEDRASVASQRTVDGANPRHGWSAGASPSDHVRKFAHATQAQTLPLGVCLPDAKKPPTPGVSVHRIRAVGWVPVRCLTPAHPPASLAHIGT